MNELINCVFGIIGLWIVLIEGAELIDNWINKESYHGSHVKEEQR